MNSVTASQIADVVKSYSPEQIAEANAKAERIDGMSIVDVIQRTMRLYIDSSDLDAETQRVYDNPVQHARLLKGLKEIREGKYQNHELLDA